LRIDAKMGSYPIFDKKQRRTLISYPLMWTENITIRKKYVLQ